MSALGHKRTFPQVQPMSALPPKADILPSAVNVRCHRLARGSGFGRRASLIQRKDALPRPSNTSFECGFPSSSGGPRSECDFLWSWSALELAPGGVSGTVSPGADLLDGGNDVTRSSNASSAVTYVGTRLADHCSGVHHVGGHARRSYFASVAAQRVHFVVGVRSRWLRGEHGRWVSFPSLRS
jgi:hypothetical protein